MPSDGSNRSKRHELIHKIEEFISNNRGLSFAFSIIVIIGTITAWFTNLFDVADRIAEFFPTKTAVAFTLEPTETRIPTTPTPTETPTVPSSPTFTNTPDQEKLENETKDVLLGSWEGLSSQSTLIDLFFVENDEDELIVTIAVAVNYPRTCNNNRVDYTISRKVATRSGLKFTVDGLEDGIDVLFNGRVEREPYGGHSLIGSINLLDHNRPSYSSDMEVCNEIQIGLDIHKN